MKTKDFLRVLKNVRQKTKSYEGIKLTIVHLDDVIQCVSVYKYLYLIMLNNPSQRRRSDKQAKN